MKNTLKLIVFIILTGCSSGNSISPSAPLPVESSSFFFGKTSGPNTFAPTPYNLYRISGRKLFGTFVQHINQDSLGLYPMTELSQEKYQITANLQPMLPSAIFSETKTLVGLINIDSGYDFIKVSREAGTTKFFYIGDAGVPDYLKSFKEALDQDLSKLSN